MFDKVSDSSLPGLIKPYCFSYWDFILMALALLASIIQFGQKSTFLHGIYRGDVNVTEYLALALVNFAAYAAIVVWVFILLSTNKSSLLRIYVVCAGVAFTTINRIIEGGGESTRQGVDFELLNHLLLAFLGHGGWAEKIIVFFFQYALFIVLFAGLLYRLYLDAREKQYRSGTVYFIFIVFTTIAFVIPPSDSVPKSLRGNGVVYAVKTAWFPVKDIRPDTLSSFRFDGDEIKTSVYRDKFFGIAKDMNVVIIALESTSANMLEFYPDSDVAAGLTPFMSKWSHKSLLINEVASVMNSTSKSLVSILCGIEPYLKIEVFEVTLGLPVNCLPQRLFERGYHTVYFQSATKLYEGRDQLANHVGFGEFISVDLLPEHEKEGMRAIGPFGLEDKVMLGAHQRWLERQTLSPKPFMAFYMTLAQHHPYLPGNGSDSSNHYVSDNYHLNRFLNSLRYVDKYLEEIVDQYREAGLYDNTVFIVVGDHGESFGRYHRPWFHNNVLYREGSWVPFFIINEEIIPEYKELKGQFSLLDVAPTVEYLLGFDTPQSYRGSVVFDNNNERLIFSACWYKNRCLAAMDNQYKYIFNYEDMPEELYEYKKDFREQENLAEKYPEITARYRHETFSWYHDVMSAYEFWYSLGNPDFKEDPDSYFRFSDRIIPDRFQLKAIHSMMNDQ